MFLLIRPDHPPSSDAPQSAPKLAERNQTWERLCLAVDCNTLPMDFFTIDLRPGLYDTPSDRRVRLHVPLNDTGRPIVAGWGSPRTAAQYDANGRILRQYFAGRRFKVICCPNELSIEMDAVADWHELMIQNVVWFGVSRGVNQLGTHLYGRVSSATDLVMDPSAPPVEFLEEYNQHFWSVTHRYQLNGDRIDGILDFLSKNPLIAGHYLYVRCGGTTCNIHTLQDREDRNGKPHISFSVGGGVELVGVRCATRHIGGDCVTVDGIMRDLAGTAAVIDALTKMLVSPS